MLRLNIKNYLQMAAMSGQSAKEKKVGGEVLCYVW
jgi:ribosomal protein S8